MNGSYKDSSAGKRDCQGFQTVQSLRTSLFVHMCSMSTNGAGRPNDKRTRHNLYDALMYSLAAVLCILLFGTLSNSVYDKAVIHTLAILIFLPFFIVVVGLVKHFVLKYF